MSKAKTKRNAQRLMKRLSSPELQKIVRVSKPEMQRLAAKVAWAENELQRRGHEPVADASQERDSSAT